MGTRHLRSVFDYASAGLDLAIDCDGCGKSAVLDAKEVVAHLVAEIRARIDLYQSENLDGLRFVDGFIRHLFLRVDRSRSASRP